MAQQLVGQNKMVGVYTTYGHNIYAPSLPIAGFAQAESDLVNVTKALNPRKSLHKSLKLDKVPQELNTHSLVLNTRSFYESLTPSGIS